MGFDKVLPLHIFVLHSPDFELIPNEDDPGKEGISEIDTFFL
jgi:hypothetical protein